MIITLKNANFSTNNIGTLDTWRISVKLGVGATYNGPRSVKRGEAFSCTIIVDADHEKAYSGNSTTNENISMGNVSGVAHSSLVSDEDGIKTYSIEIESVTGNVVINFPTINVHTGEEEPSEPNTPGGDEFETDNNVVFNFDFTRSTLADYADKGIFTVPDNATLDSIIYDNNGANLNNNLPNGLNLVNPIDASRPWTLEFTANFATPSDLVGNRRAFLTGSSAVSGSTMTPFVVINSSKLDSLGFQISNGSHMYIGGGKLTYDAEASYKITYNGAGVVTVLKDGTDLGSANVNFANSQFEVLLGAASGKSSAYIWKDVETDKKSYLKTIKFYYN